MKILFILLSLLLIISPEISAQTYPPVYVVLFTHIEDNTPSSDLNTPQARIQYMNCRNGMIGMAKLAQKYSVEWSFEPDWKILLAALLFEDSAAMQNTNGKNFLRYLKEDLNVIIDAHSHEKQGYNYTDVAHLLDSLGTGGTTVIGGHVWDPSIPQFQNWDRFRVPVYGMKYPWAIWRGDILMGSATPNHVNDAIVSGVWRPKDRNNFYNDDPNGNIFCVGQYKDDVSGIPELINSYRSGKVQPDKILTASFHILPISITTAGGLQAIEDTVIKPLVAMRNRGEIILTDFTSLISEWKKRYNSVGHIYDPTKTTNINETNKSIPDEILLYQNYPNPFATSTAISYRLSASGFVRLEVFDMLGRRVATLVDEEKDAGEYTSSFDIRNSLFDIHVGVYFYRLMVVKNVMTRKMIVVQ